MNKLKASDLRIGNYATLLSKTWEITARMIFEQHQSDIANSVYLEPIPLTEEILLMLGAKKQDIGNDLSDDYHFLWNVNRIYICLPEQPRYANSGKALMLLHGTPIASFPCEYLHSLQNLYHALTGEELIFDL